MNNRHLLHRQRTTIYRTLSVTLSVAILSVFGVAFSDTADGEIHLMKDARISVTELPASVERELINQQPLLLPIGPPVVTNGLDQESDVTDTADKQGTADQQGTADRYGTADETDPKRPEDGTVEGEEAGVSDSGMGTNFSAHNPQRENMNQSNSNELEATDRSRVKRGRNRASYDRELINAIIDEAHVSFLGLTMDDRPFVLPTSHWRDGDRIYWHGASSGRMTKGVIGKPVCLSIALLDGLVLARSAVHHSVNYRSVMLFGEPEAVTDPNEKAKQLELLINRLSPDRWQQLRPMQENELKATGIVSMLIDEGSAKVRAAPPADDEADYEWPVWAGVVPLERSWGTPEPCARLNTDCDAPIIAGNWSR